jgi:hypothetical protein
LSNISAFDFQNALKIALALTGMGGFQMSPIAGCAAAGAARNNNKKTGTRVWRNSIRLQTC